MLIPAHNPISLRALPLRRALLGLALVLGAGGAMACGTDITGPKNNGGRPGGGASALDVRPYPQYGLGYEAGPRPLGGIAPIRPLGGSAPIKPLGSGGGIHPMGGAFPIKP